MTKPKDETFSINILKNAPDAIVVIDSDRNILVINDQVEKLFGYSRDELIGMSHDILLPEEIRTPHEGHMEKYFIDPKTRPMGIGLQLNAKKKDGSLFPVVVSLSPARMNDQDVVISSVRDATEYKRKEEETKKSEQRYDEIFNSAPNVIILVNEERKIIDVNDRGVEILGYEREELIGQSHDLLLPERFREGHGDKMMSYLSEPRNRPMGIGLRLIARRKDGSEFPVEVSLSPIEQGKDKAKGTIVISILRDMSLYHEMERELSEREKRYHGLFNESPVALWETDFSDVKNYFNRLKKQGIYNFKGYFDQNPEKVHECLSLVHIVAVNDAALKIYHAYDKEELKKSFQDIFTDESSGIFKKLIVALAEGKTSIDEEGINFILTDEEIKIFMKGVVVSGYEDTLERVLISINDITQIKEAEEVLRKFESTRFEALTATAPDGIITANSQSEIIYWNEAAERLFGYPPNEVINKKITLIMPERYREPHQKAFNKAVAERDSPLHIKTVELEGLRSDGSEFPIEVSLAKWSVEDEIYFGAIVRDITDRKAAEETIKHMAYYDKLTDLPNRRLFKTLLEKTVATASRDHKMLAMLYLDLDGFKQVNDTLGHDAGDLLLKAVAGRIKGRLREEDIGARVGGDEFIVVISDLSKKDEVAGIANQLVKSLSEPYNLEKTSTSDVSASIGIAIYPEDSDDLDYLTIRADAAMRAAKQAGGNGFRFIGDEKEVA